MCLGANFILLLVLLLIWANICNSTFQVNTWTISGKPRQKKSCRESKAFQEKLLSSKILSTASERVLSNKFQIRPHIFFVALQLCVLPTSLFTRLMREKLTQGVKFVAFLWLTQHTKFLKLDQHFMILKVLVIFHPVVLQFITLN